MLPYFFYRKKIITKTEIRLKNDNNDRESGDIYPTTTELTNNLTLTTLMDMLIFGLGVSSVSFCLGYFFGLSTDSKSIMYLLMVSIIIGLFSAIGFKIDFKNIGNLTIGAESQIYKEVSGTLIGTYISCLCFFIILGYLNGKHSTKNEFSILNPYKELPFEQGSLKLNIRKTKEWFSFTDSLRNKGYSNKAIMDLTTYYIKEYNQFDSLNSEIKKLNKSNDSLKNVIIKTKTN